MGKRRALTAEEKRRKELIRELLKDTPLKNGQDLNNIMKEFITEIVNGGLEANWMTSLDTINTISRTKRRTTQETVTGIRHCKPATEM